MPIIFANSVAEVFFWIFLSLFIASAVARLVLRDKKWSLYTASCPLFCLGLAFVCLTPYHPLIYISCFIMALGDFLRAKEGTLWLILAAVMIVGAQIINLAVLVFAILVANVILYCEIVILVGYVLYAASELLFDRLGRLLKMKNRTFYVLALYYLGQLCIYLGLVLSLANL